MGEDTGETVDGPEEERGRPQTVAQSLDQFIAGVIEEAHSQEGLDAELLGILTSHIVKEEPAGKAIARAAAEIEQLAETRASAPKEESADGGDNN